MKNNTLREYSSLEQAYQFFDVRLFDGRLPDCLIVLQRAANAAGYFVKNRYRGRATKCSRSQSSSRLLAIIGLLCSDYLILSRWLRLHYLQLGLQSSSLAHTYRFFCSLSLQLSGQENGGFLNRCRYAHQTAENLGFLGNQPGKKFKVSFDDGHTSFLTV